MSSIGFVNTWRGRKKQTACGCPDEQAGDSWVGDACLGANKEDFTVLHTWEALPSPNFTCSDLKRVINKHMANFNETENLDTIILAEIQTSQYKMNRNAVSDLSMQLAIAH